MQVLTTILVLLTIASAAQAAGPDVVVDSNWPTWRGPLGTGVAPDADPPTEWNTEKNVRWRYEDPGLGFSSPIVWGDRVFITTVASSRQAAAAPEPEQRGVFGAQRLTTPRDFLLIALDRETGDEIWRRIAIEAIPHEGYHKTLSSFANMSPTTDGEHVFVSFGSRGVYAYDFDGELLWKRDFHVKMEMFNRFGEASSPALHGDTVVVSFDHEGDSFIAALDKGSGETLWRKDRDESTSWTSPFIFEHRGQAQVVVNGNLFVDSYDLETGDILWKITGMTKAPIPGPVYGHDMVFLASGTNGQAFKAVRLGGEGDLTDTDAEVWSLNKGVPYNSTPLLWGDEIYLLKEGMRGPTFISALDARTGKQHYFNARLPESWVIRSSPVGASGKIYLCSEEGDVIVMRRGTELEVLAVNTMDELMLATPAIAGRDIFIRTREHLYRIAQD